MLKIYSAACFIFLLLLSPVQAGVLMQGFYWDSTASSSSWWNHLSQQCQSLSQSGFTALWIPPVLKGASGGYSNGYDPYDDYDLGSKDQRSTVPTRWGTREELTRTVAICRANGLDIYFDNVLAHRNGDDGSAHFNYKDSTNGWNGRFKKHPDYFYASNGFGRQLNYSHPEVRSQLIQAGDWLIKATGTQGMRIDMAKNVSPEFLREYLGREAMSGSFVVSEYWSENLDELEGYVKFAMGDRVSAFDFPLWGRLKDMANGNGFFDMRQLTTAGLIRRLPNKSVTFVENHDTDRDYPTRMNKHLAYAFILTSEGYPTVFWKDYFNYGLKNIIDPLVWIHEKLAHGSTQWRWADDDLLVYERSGAPGLLVGLNDNQVWARSEWVQTSFGSFITLHDYTGNAPDLRTEADGRVEIKVPANSYVAYAPVGINSPHELRSYKVQQQFAGAHDLDIPGLTNFPQTIGRVWAQENTNFEGQFHIPQDSLNTESAITVSIGDSTGHPVFEKKLVPVNGKFEFSFSTKQTGWQIITLQWNNSEMNLYPTPFWLDLTYTSTKTL